MPYTLLIHFILITAFACPLSRNKPYKLDTAQYSSDTQQLARRTFCSSEARSTQPTTTSRRALIKRAARATKFSRLRLPDELSKLQGTWENVSYQIGETKAARRMGPFAVEIRGNAWIQHFGEATKYFRIELDPSHHPKHLDLLELVEGRPTRRLRCLYQLNGNRLIVCREYHSVDAKRPQRIAPQGKFIGVSVWQRRSRD